MSYKQLDQIRDLYESVNDIENRDNELVNEVILIVSTSMFVEGYTNVAIKNYFDCVDPVEIVEKYEEYSKDFLFVDEKTLNESVEHDLVLDEESIKELNLIIEKYGVGSFVKGLKKVAAPYLASMKTGARKALKADNPVMKKIYAAKDGIKNKIKKVSTKSNQLELPLPKNTSAKDTVSNITKTVKDKSKETTKKILKPEGTKKVKDIASKAKEIGGKAVTKAKETYKKLPKTVKNVLKFGGGAGAGLGITKLAGGNKENKKPETKSLNKTTPTPDTKEPRYDISGVTGVDKGTAITQKGKEQAAFNRGERKARKDLNDPTLNLTKSEIEAKKKTDPPKETKVTEKPKKMSAIEKKNRARFGDAHVDKLKAKQKDFKLMKSKKMSKDDFIKKYPKSITAQQAAGLRDHTEWDAFDIVSNYLIDSNQVDNMDEALYVMTEMDAQTIQGIVEDFKK